MSNMRYLKLPQPQIWVDPATGTTKVVTAFDFHDDFVLGDPAWRKDEATQSAWNRLVEALDEAKQHKARFIALTQDDFAIALPIGTMRDKQFGGPNVRVMAKMTQMWTFATTQKPADFDPAPASNGQTAAHAPETSDAAS